ncbi:MAG TPA: hypothetical protein VIT92_09875 [Burkholderiaceae bacterium]
MANKALATRQKMMIRLEPAQRVSKPRNPYAVAAMQRVAGPHKKSVSAQRQEDKRKLEKTLTDPDADLKK